MPESETTAAMPEAEPLLPSPDLESPFSPSVLGAQPHHLAFVFAVLTACCTVGMSASVKWAGKASVTPYTSNFVGSVVGTVTMTVLLLAQRKPFTASFPRWQWWFLVYGVALWFFMWGTVRALQLLDISSWQSMTTCLTQALVMIIAAAFLGEEVTKYKVGVLVRNLVVITLISQPPFIFGGKATVTLGGLAFILVQSMGASISSVIQRHLCDQPTESLLFWGFLANVIYWLPPGVSPPQLRMAGLWPATDQDHLHKDMFLPTMFAVLASTFSAFWYVCAGHGLKYMNAANFFLLLVPITLVLSVLVSVSVFHESIDGFTVLALGIIAVGFGIDRWWESK